MKKEVNKTPREKVADVVGVILSEVQMRPLSDQIPIFFTDPNISYIDPYKIYNILEKLAKDENVIKKILCPPTLDLVDHEPIPMIDEEPEIYNAFWVEVNQNFESWAENYINNNKPSNTLTKKPEKYTRKALEKIWNLLQEIDEKRQLSPSNKVGIVQYTHDRSGDPIESNILVEQHQDRKNILSRLESQGALQDVHSVEKSHELYWYFFITDKYEEVFANYQGKYRDMANEYKLNKALEKNVSDQPQGLIYTLEYSEITKKIKVNGFLLAKLNFDSENEIIFDYVYKNQNKKITRKEIEEKTGRSIMKSLHKVVENLKFKGDLRKAFFDVSVDTIKLRNPVTPEILKELEMEEIKISF